MRKWFILTGVILTVACSCYGAGPGTVDQLIQQYFEAYNSGNPDVMGAFLAKNFAQQPAGAPDRLAMYKSMWNEVGRLEVQKLLISGAGVEVGASSEKGERFSFLFDIADGRIRSVRISAGVGGQREPKKDQAGLIQALTEYLQNLASTDEFSGVVLLAKDFQPVFQHTYGLAERSFRQPNNMDTLFNLGSINKVFTKIAIAQLLDQKKLALDDTLLKALPGYPNREVASKVTIRQLLEMESGMGDIFNEKYENTPTSRFRKLSDYLPLFVDEPLSFEPGSRRSYSNAGYIVLGLVIEHLSGEDYYDYLQRHIFGPAGMTRSGCYEADDPVENLAEGYTRMECASGSPCPRKRNIYSRPARGSSAGGGYSTAGDLLKLMQALNENKLISADNPLSFAHHEIGVAGGAPGMNAAIESNGGYLLIVLSNYDPPAAEQVAEKFNAWVPAVKLSATLD